MLEHLVTKMIVNVRKSFGYPNKEERKVERIEQKAD